MSIEPKLKGKGPQRRGPHPLGELPDDLVVRIGKHIVHRISVGQADITGDDFGTILAKALDGEHRQKPLGIADVTWNECAWCVKTIQDKNPFNQKKICLISGRNSPQHSYEINDPLKDIEATGAAVLNIWNKRLNQSLAEHDDMRIFILIRNMATLQFTLIEMEASRFIPADYRWEKSKGKNLWGFHRLTNERRFRWQPHGSQFSIFHQVPASACRFRIVKQPPVVEEHEILKFVGYEDSWIQKVSAEPQLL